MANRRPENQRPFCRRCGSETILKCQHCQSEIPGQPYFDGVIHAIRRLPVPEFCHRCGKAYPWHGLKIPARVPSANQRSNKIFVVHGHDSDMKEQVARVLEKLKLSPIILHEQPSQSKTLIEKFGKHSDVGFAIVLMSPDDVGKAKEEKKLRDRARQNVVFELGYFVGKLGRRWVFALKRGDVEIPSDWHGVVYNSFDEAGAWKLKLIQELQECQYSVDANDAIRSKA